VDNLLLHISCYYGYYINGYWWIICYCILVVIMVIILMAIGGYSINDYW